MANVRIDQNGVPKAPVYEATTPTLHRSAITAVDASDPADTSGAVDASGYRYCDFDVELAGSGITSLDLVVLFWNPTAAKWFEGAGRQLTQAGKVALRAEARGRMLFLKVKAFSGTSFSLTAHAALS